MPPEGGRFYAGWTASPQTASGSFDAQYTVNTNKTGLETGEKVDGATIEIEPGSGLPHETFLDEVASDVHECVSANNWQSPVDLRGESDYGMSDYQDTDYGPENDGVTDYGDGQSNYDEGQSNYDDGQSNYDDGQSNYDDGQTNYDDGQSDYDN